MITTELLSNRIIPKGLKPKRRKAASPLPHDCRGLGRKVDHGRGDDPARTAVEDRIDSTCKSDHDLVRIVQRQFVTGQYQGRAHDGLPETLEQSLRDRMVRDA